MLQVSQNGEKVTLLILIVGRGYQGGGVSNVCIPYNMGSHNKVCWVDLRKVSTKWELLQAHIFSTKNYLCIEPSKFLKDRPILVLKVNVRISYVGLWSITLLSGVGVTGKVYNFCIVNAIQHLYLQMVERNCKMGWCTLKKKGGHEGRS